MIAWIDVETTDLDERIGYIIEIAVAATDDQLEKVVEGPSLVVLPEGPYVETGRTTFEQWQAIQKQEAPARQARALAAMHPVVREMHEKSGLLEALAHPDFCVSLPEAEQRCGDFFFSMAKEIGGALHDKTVDAVLRATPIAGSSVHFDRRWIRQHMPRLEALFSYRILDVSSLKECALRWAPTVYEARPRDEKNHRAMPDVLHSIEELRHYRWHLFGGTL